MLNNEYKENAIRDLQKIDEEYTNIAIKRINYEEKEN